MVESLIHTSNDGNTNFMPQLATWQIVAQNCAKIGVPSLLCTYTYLHENCISIWNGVKHVTSNVCDSIINGCRSSNIFLWFIVDNNHASKEPYNLINIFFKKIRIKTSKVQVSHHSIIEL